MKESIQSFGWAKRLSIQLETGDIGTHTTPHGWIHARHCTRGGERTGGLRLTFHPNNKHPWEPRPSSERRYLRAGWTESHLSRLLFRWIKAPTPRPMVEKLYRRVEEEGPLPLDFMETIDQQPWNPVYTTMSEEDACHWLEWLEARTKENLPCLP